MKDLQLDNRKLIYRTGSLDDLADCEGVMRSLPEWFGIESAIVNYINEMREQELPLIIAQYDYDIAGFASFSKPTSDAGEIHVIAIREEFHKRGIGSVLLARLENIAKESDRSLLIVRTLGEANPDKHYAGTRQFYRAKGFKHLVEFPDYWSEKNPCLIMVKVLQGN